MKKVVNVAWDIVAIAIVIRVGYAVSLPLLNGVWSRQQIIMYKRQLKKTLEEGGWAAMVDENGKIIRTFTKIDGKIYSRVKPD